jgi:ABC-type uncharacterized transport system substrate-binding protein
MSKATGGASRSQNSPTGLQEKKDQDPADTEKAYQEKQALMKFPRFNQHIIHRSEFSVITAGNNKIKINNDVSYTIHILKSQFSLYFNEYFGLIKFIFCLGTNSFECYC